MLEQMAQDNELESLGPRLHRMHVLDRIAGAFGGAELFERVARLVERNLADVPGDGFGHPQLSQRQIDQQAVTRAHLHHPAAGLDPRRQPLTEEMEAGGMHRPQHMAVEQPVHVAFHEGIVRIDVRIGLGEGLEPVSVGAREGDFLLADLVAEPAIIARDLLFAPGRQPQHDVGHRFAGTHQRRRAHRQALREVIAMLGPGFGDERNQLGQRRAPRQQAAEIGHCIGPPGRLVTRRCAAP